MLGFIKKCFFAAVTFFSCSVLNVNSLECVSMNNQECKIRLEIINVNTNEPVFYPYRITMSKCKGSCNTINDPYAKLCVPDTIKSINVKVFNLMSRTNETRHIEWHKTCKCKSRLDASVFKNTQIWNENINGDKMLHNEILDVIPLNDYKTSFNSCTIYIVLFAVFFITSICISSVFIFFQWYLKKFVLRLILVLKQLKLHTLTIIVRSVFAEHGKYYLQIFSDECLYEV